MWLKSVLVAALATLAACGPSSPPGFVASAKTASSLTIYAGLPRDYAGDTIGTDAIPPALTIAGQRFEGTKHAVSGSAANAIATLLDDPSIFRSHVDGKKCGGFHADYAVEWGGAGDVRRVLLCFGCGEVRSIGDGEDTLIDLTEDGEARLEAAIAKAVGK